MQQLEHLALSVVIGDNTMGLRLHLFLCQLVERSPCSRFLLKPPCNATLPLGIASLLRVSFSFFALPWNATTHPCVSH